MATTLFVLPSVVLGTATMAGAYGVRHLVLDPSSQCRPVTVPAPARNSFEVKIFNATGVDGAATSAAEQLKGRGFRVTEVATQPGLESSRFEVRHGRAGLDAALLLAQQIPGAQVSDDGRADSSVSAVLGRGYTGLVAVPPPPPPRPEKITVNVYNATWRPGLATQVADGVRARGFRIDTVGNDPRRSYLPEGTAVIRYGKGAQPAAKVLARHIPGATLTRDDRGTGNTTIDLVVGNRYTALTPVEQVPAPPPPPAPTPPATVTRPCP